MKKGFTLAEVLVTLVIIGVVAALTIPILVGKYQKSIYVTQLKKTYSTLQNAINLSIAENGDPSTWPFANMSDITILAEKYLLPYLNVKKNCSYSSSGTTGCMASSYKFLFEINGYDQLDDRYNYYRFVLADGASVAMKLITNGYIWFAVDVNGPGKAPNQIGRDTFVLTLGKGPQDWPTARGKGKLSGYGWQESLSSVIANCNPASIGDNVYGSCFERIIKEGWKMNY